MAKTISNTSPRDSLRTVGAALQLCATRLRRAKVFFGHGADNARDEAAELVFYCARLPHSLGARAYALPLGAVIRRRIHALLEKRIGTRAPLAYLTRRAFFAGLELYVDARVLVPRSPIAELALRRFQPWVKTRRVRRILDIGTGSGAIALACARAFPRAQVDAVDISRPALAVCRRNIARQRLKTRVRALYSDHFSAVHGRQYDIIVSNPPYVGVREMRALPREYRHEPRLALASGKDGLDSVRAIFRDAAKHLAPQGVLVVEVGNTERILQRAFPHLPFTWPDFARGGAGVFLLYAEDLARE
jgi:ribosomal protein L3 glutamine methyltransferase